MKTFYALLGILTVAAFLQFGQKVEAASFQPTASMTTARFYHTATLLANGKVLVTGGAQIGPGSNIPLSSAEIYDPATGNWTSTGTMSAGRYVHTGTLLANGKVMVAGGYTLVSGALSSASSAEIYDPATGTWTSAGTMSATRRFHTATLLTNGNVMVVGGFDDASGHALSTAEMYDATTGNWTSTGTLSAGRERHTATLLANSKAIVMGGYDGNGYALSSAEIYDAATGNWTSTGNMSAVRQNHAATLLTNGSVMVLGGADASGNGLSSAEIYDPTTGNWTSTGTMSAVRRGHTATLLVDGKVLVTGGYNDSGQYLNAEIYDPAMGNWTSAGPMSDVLGAHTATLLTNGKVLIAGGVRQDSKLGTVGTSSAELYATTHDLRVTLVKAVRPSFSGLTLATNYQLQLSGDMNTWTNHASPFTATNSNMSYSEYWDIDSWGKLFFRLKVAP